MMTEVNFYCERNEKIARAARAMGAKVATRGHRMVIRAGHEAMRKIQLRAARPATIFQVDSVPWEEAVKAWL